MPPKKKEIKAFRPPMKDTYCMGHGFELNVEEFFYWEVPKGSNPQKWDYLPYCKTCSNEAFNAYLKKYKSVEAAVYFTCALVNLPFMKSVYESMEKIIQSKGVKNPSFLQYTNQLDIAKNKKGWSAKCFADSDVELGEIKKLQKSDVALKQEMERLELDWGKQSEYDDYSFLELKFETYVEGRQLTPAMEQTFRYLCLAELEARKLKDDNQDSKTVEEKIQKYYKILNLDKFDNNAIKTDEEKFIEARIAIIERNEPAEFYEDKRMYADHQGFELYAENHIRRPMKNMLLGQKEYRIKKEGE